MDPMNLMSPMTMRMRMTEPSLKQVAGKAVDVDYIIWLWKKRPEAVWD